MVSSGLQTIVRILLLLTVIVSANAQPAADKTSTSSISGKVTVGSKGVSGVVVVLAVETSFSSTYVTRWRAVTDEEGNYRIKKVPAGSYQVLVAAADYLPNTARTSVVVGKNEAVENINLTLIHGGVITGKVTDADGRPVVEEQVFFSGNSNLPYWRTVRTDDRGVYRAFGLPPGRYTVYAGKDSMAGFGRPQAGYLRTYHPSTVNASDATPIEVNEGSEATNVDITLGRQLEKYVARGRIIDGDTSQPVPNAHIGVQFFFGANGSTSSGNAAESTKDGEFKIENLPAGKYAVYLESQANAESFSEPVRFEVIDQDVDGLLIKTSKGATAAGIIVVEGTQDPSVRTLLVNDKILAFVSSEYGRTPPSANINPDGSFRLTGLPAGRLMLQLRQTIKRLHLLRIERDGVVYRNGIEIKEREQVTGLRVVVSQANGTIRGVLKLPEGVALPATARLRVSARSLEDPTIYNEPVDADANGQFLVKDLVAGTYQFSVSVFAGPDDQRPRIQRPPQTVAVTNGGIAEVTILLQIVK